MKSGHFKLVSLLLFAAVAAMVVSLACGGGDDDETAAPAPPPPPTPDVAGIIKEAVSSVPQGASAAEMQKLVTDSVAAAIAAQPAGVTRADVEAAVISASQGQLSAADVERIVDRAIGALPAPEIDVAQIEGLVEAAVRANVPRGTSATEIQRMVTAAVTAATADAATRGDLETLVAESIRGVAADQLTGEDVQKIVDASVVATNKAIEEAAMATADQLTGEEVQKIVDASLAATNKAIEEAAMAAQEAAAKVAALEQQIVDVTAPEEIELTDVTFKEAPILTELVNANLLPPVEDRLPVDPAVIVPLERVGQYGGTLRRMHFSSGDHWNMGYLNFEGLVRFNRDGSALIPSIAKSWWSSEGDKVWTFKLREGLKWSDGAPFTMEDFLFEHEDVQLNKELFDSPPSRLFAGGEFVQYEVVDDTTIRFRFAAPNPAWPITVAQLNRPRGLEQELFSPKHYLKQFHIKYNANANELAKQEGFADWTEIFASKDDIVLSPDRPTMRPWALRTRLSDQQMIAERNPYYYYVDTEGNQLPYIDRVVWTLTPNAEVRTLNFLAGKVDFQGRGLGVSNFPLAKENEAKGDYHVILQYPLGGGNAIKINNTLEGPLGDLFREKNFRIALSLAIERDAINDIQYLGLAEARNPVPLPSHPYYPGDEYRDLHIDYNIAEANKLLDELGLTAKDSDGFRLDKEGDTINIVWKGADPGDDIPEIIKKNWEDIGIKVTLRSAERTILYTETTNNTYHIHAGGIDTSHFIYTDPTKTAPVQSDWLSNMGPAWGKWHETGGAEGLEPPDEIKELINLHVDGAKAGPSEAAEMGKEIFRNISENVWYIGLVGLSPGPVVVKNSLVNVPMETAGSFATRNVAVTLPEQFWYDKECRRAGELDC